MSSQKLKQGAEPEGSKQQELEHEGAKQSRRQGQYYTVSLVELVIGVITIGGFVTLGYGFLWTQLDSLRSQHIELVKSDTEIRVEYQHLKEDLDQTKKRIMTWSTEEFSDSCRFQGGKYDFNGHYCESKDGRSYAYRPLALE